MLREVLPVWAAWAAGVAIVLLALRRSGEYGFLSPLFEWDFELYSYVAENGYRRGDTPAFAFLPLWPGVIAAVGPWGAAVLAWLASLAAFLGVAALSRRPRATAVALACWPGSFALALVYPDGLAVAAAAWACVLASRSHVFRNTWLGIVVLGAVAAVARPAGFLVAIPLALLLRGRTRAAALAPVAAAAAVHAYFWWRDDTFGAFFRAQSHWGREGAEPLLLLAVATLAAGLIVATRYRAAIPFYVALVGGVTAFAGSLQARTEVLRLGLATLPAFALLARARMWFVYAAAVVGLSLVSGSVQSLGRQTLLAFPLVWAVAERAPRWLLAVGAVANAVLLVLLPRFAP